MLNEDAIHSSGFTSNTHNFLMASDSSSLHYQNNLFFSIVKLLTLKDDFTVVATDKWRYMRPLSLLLDVV